MKNCDEHKELQLRTNRTKLPLLFLLNTTCASALIATGSQVLAQDFELPQISPSRQIQRNPSAPVVQPDVSDFNFFDQWEQYRRIDGSNNNINVPNRGAAHTQLRRIAPNTYGDQVSSMSGVSRPNPRLISLRFAELSDSPPVKGPSDFVWQWGQFLDHDISITEGVSPPEPENINIPSNDPWFDPHNTGTQIMRFNRSVYDPSTGFNVNNPRQQINEITTWIDASNVYGSDEDRAYELRRNDGSGKMLTSEGDFLPYNTNGLANAGGSGEHLFLAGDVRANEQVGLLSMHILFVREHNRLVDIIADQYPNYNGETLYQTARKIVAAQIQAITYNEYLPVLLGRRPLSRYRGYKPKKDSTLSNIFTTALYRYGHSALSPTIRRIDADGSTLSFGDLALRDAFFSPQTITTEGGIEPILRGLAAQPSRKIDLRIVPDVTNFLFGPPGAGGFDLMALNIQRGRDHGLPTYNQARLAYGLRPASGFDDISSDPDISNRLAELYTSVDDIDVWVGALAEDRHRGMVGKLLYRSMKRQFEALRDADRFWYQRDLNAFELKEVTWLSRIIKRNTAIGSELPNNVFDVR